MFGLLRRIPGYRLLIGMLALLGIGVIAMAALRGGRAGYDVDPTERYVVARATEDAARTLARTVPMRKVLLMPLGNDGDGYIALELRDRLEEVGGFEVVERRDLGAFEALLDKIKSFVSGLLGAGRLDDVSAAPAVEAAREVQAPAVIFGKVTERDTGDQRTRVTVALRAVKTDDGGTIVAKAFEAAVRRSWTSGAYRRIWMRSRSWWGRLLAWLVVAGLLPLATAGLVKPLLARESNAVNAAILGLYTLLDALVAWGLLGFAGGGAAVILVILGALVAGVYSFVICDRLAAAAA